MAQRVGRVIAPLFHDRGTSRGWAVSSTPRPYFAPGKDSVPILQEVGWAPGPVRKGGKSRPNEFDPRTVQSVVSRYTNWATWPTFERVPEFKKGISIIKWRAYEAEGITVMKNNLTRERRLLIKKSSFISVRKIAKIESYIWVVLGFRPEVN